MTIVPRLDRGFFEFVLLHPRYTFLGGTKCPFGMRIIYALFFGRKRCIPTQKYASVAKLNVANFKNTVRVEIRDLEFCEFHSKIGFRDHGIGSEKWDFRPGARNLLI